MKPLSAKSTTVRALLALLLLPTLYASGMTQETPPTFPIVTPADARTHGLESLRTAVQQDGGVPLPDNLSDFVSDMQAARRLGKALFFDMAVGSDGVQACATCHFHAGADNRRRNQISPGLLRVENDRHGDVVGFFGADGASDTTFQTRTPNAAVQRADYPFVKNIGEGDNVIHIGDSIAPAAGNSNDVTSSMGIRRTDFEAVVPGAAVDIGTLRFDHVFNKNGTTLRRVEPRNTPTTINAVFNFDNFWDGRAKNCFNGVDPFGNQNLDAKVFRRSGSTLRSVSVSLKNASLASQAVGPPLSDFEMSFGGRTFRDLGRKVIPRLALADQEVDRRDSLLGGLRHPMGVGLTKGYEELIQDAFHSQWWQAEKDIYYPADGSEPEFVTPGTTPHDHTFTVMEANFSLLWGISIMLYEATLVSDDTPFDRWMSGNGFFVPGFQSLQRAGLNVFVGKGKCVNCHGGPELTNASIRNTQAGQNLIEPMLMGDRRPGIYDNGFYNIGVTPTAEDIGRGAADPWGHPLASSRRLLFDALGIQDIPFSIVGSPIRGLVEASNDPSVLGFFEVGTDDFFPVCRDVDGDGRCGPNDVFLLRRVAVDGAQKTPGLRNQLLMGPYFHAGSVATLMEVVEFYNRGGNFCRLNGQDLDPDIQPLGLTLLERRQLVSFLVSLTDERVRTNKAPFDGPQVLVPNGHLANGATILLEIPATGRDGGPELKPFLGIGPFGSNPVSGICSPDFGAMGNNGN